MLAESPERIDNEYLSQFPEFIQFRERSDLPGKPVSSDAPEINATSVATQTPDELLRRTIKAALWIWIFWAFVCIGILGGYVHLYFPLDQAR